MNADVKRILDKLRSLEKERAPSTTMDRCDAVILLAYIEALQKVPAMLPEASGES